MTAFVLVSAIGLVLGAARSNSAYRGLPKYIRMENGVARTFATGAGTRIFAFCALFKKKLLLPRPSARSLTIDQP